MGGETMEAYDLVVIGGGPAGLAAAIAAKKEGIDNILLLEREMKLGGILNQCIHNGFGLHYFKEELTGPEYAEKFINELITLGIQYKLSTMVIDITKGKQVTAVNMEEGIISIQAKAIILTMGCREKTRGAINIPGCRCAGIFTAGAAQKYVNIEGFMPGKSVVVLGSGDIGLIMARRMTLEGGEVKAVLELMPYSTGLKRNIVQCLDDYKIPVRYNHTIVDIKGKDRLEGVVAVKVDENRRPIKESEEFISCDTLLLSVGLIPENELSKKASVELSTITGGAIVNEGMETNIPGVFACGNVLHVHDLADNVSVESEIAGKSAAGYLKGKIHSFIYHDVVSDYGIRYTVPQKINLQQIEKSVEIRFRVNNIYLNSYVSVYFDDKRVIHNRKRILSPGEMESIKITRKLLDNCTNFSNLVIKIEEE
jgi:NADPH-dependent 2,4-dienoyl-CoA reductase/sulfur reductase-like enzyme